MKKLTAEWVKKAEADYRGATLLARGRERFYDQICFHCQQCAEKYLKALLQEIGLPVPRTHNLLALDGLLLPHHASLRPLRRGLDFLTRFAVGPRYPMYDARKRQAISALRWAGRVRDACRALLGVRPPRRRKTT
jgi:HEPN domain-containing protein